MSARTLAREALVAVRRAAAAELLRGVRGEAWEACVGRVGGPLEGALPCCEESGVVMSGEARLGNRRGPWLSGIRRVGASALRRRLSAAVGMGVGGTGARATAPTVVVGRRVGEGLESGQRAAVIRRSGRGELAWRRRAGRLGESWAQCGDEARVGASVGASAARPGRRTSDDGDAAMAVDGV